MEIGSLDNDEARGTIQNQANVQEYNQGKKLVATSNLHVTERQCSSPSPEILRPLVLSDIACLPDESDDHFTFPSVLRYRSTSSPSDRPKSHSPTSHSHGSFFQHIMFYPSSHRSADFYTTSARQHCSREQAKWLPQIPFWELERVTSEAI